MKFVSFIFFCTLLIISLFSQSAGLVEIIPEIPGNGLILFNLKIADGFHITDLKNKFFYVKLEDNPLAEIENVEFPNGVPYKEELVFKKTVALKVKLRLKKPFEKPTPLNFIIAYQVCQEEPEEICYPPEEQKLQLMISSSHFPSKTGFSISSLLRQIETKFQNHRGNFFLMIFLTFLAGFMTSLTPCVYPIIPLIIGFLGSREQKSKLHNFYLSLFFALGLALVYALLGVFVAKTGALLGVSFQKPLVVIIVSLIFILMGFSLLGLFNIIAPASVQYGFQKKYGNEIIKALSFGALAALVAAPCAGPIIVALLSYISQTGSIFKGFWLTFSYAIGLSIIFIIVGTFSNLISALPRGGNWMDFFKKLFGFLLIAGGLLILNPVLSFFALNILWGIYFIFGGLFLNSFTPADKELKNILKKLVAILIILAGVFFFFRGLSSRFPIKNEEAVVSASKQAINWEYDFSAALKKAHNQSKPVMVDFSAEWCTACNELEEETFLPLKELIQERFIALKIDLTQSSPEKSELQKKYKVVGLPTVIFLNSNGDELKRFSGFINAQDFQQLINNLAN